MPYEVPETVDDVRIAFRELMFDYRSFHTREGSGKAERKVLPGGRPSVTR
jgi:hypothetical protein